MVILGPLWTEEIPDRRYSPRASYPMTGQPVRRSEAWDGEIPSPTV